MTSESNDPDARNQLHDDLDDNEDPGWPWSFLLLVGAGAVYLIFRFVELGAKLLE